MSQDSWAGNHRQPLSLNRWNYVTSNPINYTDPSGYCADFDTECWNKAKVIVAEFPNVEFNMGAEIPGIDWAKYNFNNLTQNYFNIKCDGQWFAKHWQTSELEDIHKALKATLIAFQFDKAGFEKAFGTITFARQWAFLLAAGELRWQNGEIFIFDAAYELHWGVDVPLHEMGHLLDYRERIDNGGAVWNRNFTSATQGECIAWTAVGCLGGYTPGGTTTSYARDQIFKVSEDFAESFRVWVFSKNRGLIRSVMGGTVDQNRLNYIEQVVNQYRTTPIIRMTQNEEVHTSSKTASPNAPCWVGRPEPPEYQNCNPRTR